jgi:PPOX class probable FMN-dependent enzyme
MDFIDSIEALESLYGLPSEAANKKVTNHLNLSYRTWIEQSPFCLIASVGIEGTDVSPRGDETQVVKVMNEQTLALPDWQGNQRIDTLRNIVADGRVSLLFMVSGSNNVIRVNGHAKITQDKTLLEGFKQYETYPKTVILVKVKEVYFQCAKALMRANLWHQEDQSAKVPSPGKILKEIANGAFDDEAYDAGWPERYQKALW